MKPDDAMLDMRIKAVAPFAGRGLKHLTHHCGCPYNLSLPSRGRGLKPPIERCRDIRVHSRSLRGGVDENVGQPLNRTPGRILTEIRNNPNITKVCLVELLGLGKSTIDKGV